MRKPAARRLATASWIRRGETALVIVGLSLLGEVLMDAAHSRISQARDERVLEEEERRLESLPAAPAPSLPATREAGDARRTAPEAAPRKTEAPAAPALRPRPKGRVVLGRIEIPRVGVSAIVREGDDARTLSVAVGHVPGTALPGEPGNAVLAGHRDSFFRGLKNIRKDDRIRIRVPGSRVEYRVESTEIVAATQTSVLASTPEDRLTLVTCYPFHFVGKAPKRFIVRASPVPTDPPAAPGARIARDANGRARSDPAAALVRNDVKARERAPSASLPPGDSLALPQLR